MISPTKVKPGALTAMFESVSLGSPQNAVGFVLWRVMHHFQREADRALQAQDLTHLQFTTLALVAWMGQEGEPVTQSELSRFGDIHPMQISNVVKALEIKGLVSRTQASENALAKNVAVTIDGLKRLKRSMPIMIDLQHVIFGDDGRPGGNLLEALARIERAIDRRK